MEITDPQRPAWLSFILMFLTAMLGFLVIGPLIGVLLAIPFMSDGLISFLDKLGNPSANPEVKIPFFIMQGSATFFGLIVIPILYITGIVRKNASLLYRQFPVSLTAIAITAMALLSFMVANSYFIEWNANLKMPEFLKGFEDWARGKEDLAAELTRFMTRFESTGEFILAFVVIGILPGIGEELVFRGMLQPELHRSTKSIHAAIWISALLFSAIHVQFFGFVPRLFLGVLFGYLYYWSGNIVVPMFAHFLNNGLSVIMIYLYQLGHVHFDMDSTESAPLPLVIVFTVITFALLYYLKNFYKARNPHLK